MYQDWWTTRVQYRTNRVFVDVCADIYRCVKLAKTSLYKIYRQQINWLAVTVGIIGEILQDTSYITEKE
jgi:hypothetical protein